MTTMLELTCRDPVVSRDGRPFGVGQGNRMRSLRWPLPSVVAGSLRSTLGKASGRDFTVTTAQDLLQVEIAGLFPLAEGRMYLPAPQDCVVHRDKGPLRATPQPIEHAGCDLPDAGMQPVRLTEAQAPNDFKPDDAPAWWPMDRYAVWLAGQHIAFDDRFLHAPEIDDRTHVQLDSNSGAADDGDLFTTAALPLTHLARYGDRHDGPHSARFCGITVAIRVRAHPPCREAVAKLDALHPLGGERRLVHWKATAETSAWSCPPRMRAELASASRVRMVLVTPAIFGGGWKPGWLNGELVGTPPGSNVALRLVGVSIQRWRSVSGWSLADLPGQPRGPKPVKRLVPAGGVYFFETTGAKESDLADRWLESVSDDEQDRRDGFGLAVWGVW